MKGVVKKLDFDDHNSSSKLKKRIKEPLYLILYQIIEYKQVSKIIFILISLINYFQVTYFMSGFRVIY